MVTAKIAVGQLSVCQVVASINECTGGTAVSVTSLAEALGKQKISSHLFTLDYKHLGNQVIVEGVELHSYPATLFSQHLRGFQPKAGRAFRELVSNNIDLIHNHGLWMFPNLYARQAAVINHLPLVISPRGMLETWSLQRSWIKKWFAWFLYEKRNLDNARLFHATSIEEANSIRRLGFQQPIALIPDAVKLPHLHKQFSRNILTQHFPELSDKQWLLFLSRIHPKKGLNNLLNVWQKLAVKFPSWHLIIAGPDFIGYQAELKLLIADFALEQRVTFTGMLSGETKEAALWNAELFVLPTHSENFGIAVAEALAHAVPVVTTKGAPWHDLSTHQCGWWIENSQQALADALAEGMEMSAQERKEMGLRGRNLVETKYSWNSVGEQMSSVYHWVVGGGTPPNCVQFKVPE